MLVLDLKASTSLLRLSMVDQLDPSTVSLSSSYVYTDKRSDLRTFRDLSVGAVPTFSVLVNQHICLIVHNLL